jgi:hypothetical protein
MILTKSQAKCKATDGTAGILNKISDRKLQKRTILDKVHKKIFLKLYLELNHAQEEELCLYYGIPSSS